MTKISILQGLLRKTELHCHSLFLLKDRLINKKIDVETEYEFHMRRFICNL